MFDWTQFLDNYRIEYAPARRGWLDIWCPWCGGPGTHHLGINTQLGIYKCWLGATHRGSSARRLIAALLNCSIAEAEAIYASGSTSFARSDDTFAEDAMRRLGVRHERSEKPPAELAPLPEFVTVRETGKCRALVYPYLARRGYDRSGVDWLARRFRLMFAPSGAFSYRIILPVFRHGRMVTWTGRSVADGVEPKYRSLSTDADKAAAQGLPVAAANIKDLLFDYDQLRAGGPLLVVTEGPFDALRVAYLGESDGVRATCLFGKVPSRAQIDLLAQLVPRYQRAVVLLDRDARMEAFTSIPDYLGIRSVDLPAGADDPAELTAELFDVLLDTVL